MIYDYTKETGIRWFGHTSPYHEQLLFVRVGFGWFQHATQVSKHGLMPGMCLLGVAETICKTVDAPFLKRIFFSWCDDPLDCITTPDGACCAKPLTVTAGSPDFKTPSPQDHAHPSGVIVHRRVIDAERSHWRGHSAQWGYTIGRRPKRYDHPLVFGFGWGGNA